MEPEALRVYRRRERAVLAGIAVLELLALSIWGLVVTFGVGPHAQSPLGPVATIAALAGFVTLFTWAREANETSRPPLESATE